MIRSHAQHESMHVLHAKARARMLIISGSLKAANIFVCSSRVCQGVMLRTPGSPWSSRRRPCTLVERQSA